MVMKRNIMRRNLRQSILKSLGRYFAIVLIIALGAGIFVGLRASKGDMVATGQKFMDEQNMFDLRFLTSYGWSLEDLDKISRMDGLEDVEGMVSVDAIVSTGRSEDEAEKVFRFHNIPEAINRPALRGGRWPEKPNECLIDGYNHKDEALGTRIEISNVNDEENRESLKYSSYIVVGYVASPLYMDAARGSTSIGSGKLAGYVYLLPKGFDVDYYTEIDATIPTEGIIYTEEYDADMEEAADSFETLLDPLAQERLSRVRRDAQEAYDDGLKELEDGRQRLQENRDDTRQKFEDALKELEDGEKELENQTQRLAGGDAQLDEARHMLSDTQGALNYYSTHPREAVRDYTGIEIPEGVVPPMVEDFGESVLDITADLAGLQLDLAGSQLEGQGAQLYAGKAAIAQARKELDEGWDKYERGKKDAEKSFRIAEKRLNDAEEKLAEAKDKIADMTENEAIVLDRNTNVGYTSLDSNSNILAGVSKVFPLFFLLIAALVCITTMARMVNEERTQIGTLKALGYSSGAIAGKYLRYAGSGAILGCGLGVLVGSVVFPMILWKAYCIMIYITPVIEIRFNWPLCITVVVAYTAVMLLVTWNCCRKELREVPAELIRPKAPTSGKKVIFERFKIWDRVSFLNKVAIRNIFRYHRRLAMMLIGIGGCTALLVTGFGLRDSIMDIVSYQYEDISNYDMEVIFSDVQSDSAQKDFIRELGDKAGNVVFFHQTSADLEYNHKVRELSLIVSGERLQEVFNFHDGKEALPMPGENEVLLSVGAAEALKVKPGSTVVLRDSDMRELELTVSGLFDNYVSNYAVVRPETVRAQWRETPGAQMAYVQCAEGENPHEMGAGITGMDGVLNVTVNREVANLVSSMMESLNLVVITVVFCAGLLAIIVLYNLTNININERIREIAAIKVLGFNARETAAYVFKENIALSVMGCIVGLPAGLLLLKFVMSQIKVDTLWLQARLTPLSIGLSLALTVLSALIVMAVFYFKLDKIDMANALKSVE